MPYKFDPNVWTRNRNKMIWTCKGCGKTQYASNDSYFKGWNGPYCDRCHNQLRKDEDNRKRGIN